MGDMLSVLWAHSLVASRPQPPREALGVAEVLGEGKHLLWREEKGGLPGGILEETLPSAPIHSLRPLLVQRGPRAVRRHLAHGAAAAVLRAPAKSSPLGTCGRGRAALGK